MSGLHDIAKHVAAHGRGEDTVLIHMTPTEVGGLQALALAHGGSLTINPHTGLPEAGFLSSILPMIAGVGLNFLFPGLGALGSAALVGGVTGVASHDIGKGLLAGLGAYGGFGLAEGLGALGSSAALNAPGAASLVAPGAEAAAEMGLGSLGAEATANVAPVADGFAGRASNAWSGLTHAGDSWDATKAAFGGEKGLFKTAGAAAAPLLFGDSFSSTATKMPGTGNTGVIRPYTYERETKVTPYDPTQPASVTSIPGNYMTGHYVAGTPYQYVSGSYADGGPVQQMSDRNIMGHNTMWPGAMINQSPAQVQTFSGEPRFADGGTLLRGPGDGVSDDIHATIQGQEPVRLADGEFIIPARAVSELGNGSTEAGSRQLYAMLDRIQERRRKSAKADHLAVDSKAYKELPA